MKKRTSAIAMALVLLSALIFTGCGEKAGGTAKKGNGDLKVAVVCSGSGQNDNGYNQSACDGIKETAEEIGCEYKIIEPVNGVPEALETLADDGYNLIFSLEYDFDALIKGVGGSEAIASQYPDTTFVVFNDNPNKDESGEQIHKNVISVLFDVHEASYLAGYLSVQINENMDKLFDGSYRLTPLDTARGIGFIGGTNSNGILVYSYGFIEGINQAAQEYGTKYDYYAKYDAGFTDSALGSTVAGTFFDEGANVVFADAGVVGDGITAKAKEVGKIAIQTDANLDTQQPGHVLTSVLKITGVPVKVITKSYADGKIAEMERLQTYNLASGATGITDLAEMGKHVKDAATWEEIKEKVQKISDQIAGGEIKVTNKQLNEEFDPAKCPNVVIKTN
ncbi:MAG: BMP family ABC transporter substrate-binding protein [Lachnospiraceae bacterium]|jgi:basic membrane protein A|nr:BMP family ABC transporter substrate-binding protein [Lachnospiraceae bacterium]